MANVQFSDKILFEDLRDVLRVHLYTKLLEHKIKPCQKDIDLIVELYLCGGYSGTEEQTAFIKTCLEKKYFRTTQSVRNTLSKYTTLKVLHRPKNRKLYLSPDFIPTTDFDTLLIHHYISHRHAV